VIEVEFEVTQGYGPLWIIILMAGGIPIAFLLGLQNSVYFYKTLPHHLDADVVVFYQPGCPHCVAEIPVIKKLVAMGYKVSAINVLENVEVAREYNVTSTPTLYIPKTHSYLVGEQSLEDILNALKSTVNESGGGACSVNSCSYT